MTPPDLAELLDRWWPFVRRLARKHLRHAYPNDPAADADDLAQEIALRVAGRFGTFRPCRGAFSTWLAFVARSTAADLRQRNLAAKRAARPLGSTRRDGSDRLAAVADPLGLTPPEVIDARGEEDEHARRLARLRRSVGRLRPRQRDAVKKRFGLGGEREHQLREIDPDRTPEANRLAVERGLAKLRERAAR